MVRSRGTLIRIGVALILLALTTLLLMTALSFGFKNGEMRLTTGNSAEIVVEYTRAQNLSFVIFLLVESGLAWFVLKAGWMPLRRLPVALRFVLLLIVLTVLCVVLTFCCMALSMAGLLNWLVAILDGLEKLMVSAVTPSS